MLSPMPALTIPVQLNSIPEKAAADSLIPTFDQLDDQKRQYLSYRINGFSKQESADLTGIPVKIVKVWAEQDEVFYKWDKAEILQLRREFGRELTSLLFARNMLLAMQKDEVLLRKSLVSPDLLTEREWQLLKTARPLYVPGQLEILEKGFKNAPVDTSFDELLIYARKYAPNGQVSLRDERIYGDKEGSRAETVEEQFGQTQYIEGSCQPVRE